MVPGRFFAADEAIAAEANFLVSSNEEVKDIKFGGIILRKTRELTSCMIHYLSVPLAIDLLFCF